MASDGKKRRVIVNADDLGFSDAITEGILRAHREGIVTSATLTANMPAAERAVALARQHPELGVGVHLNVSQGPPLSKAGAALAEVDGQIHRTAAGVVLGCLRSPRLLKAVEAEFDAQIRWVLDHGLRPTHLDSHRHAHAFGPVYARVAKLARRYHIRFIRRPYETLPGRGWPAATAKQRRVAGLVSVFGLSAGALAPEFLACRATWGLRHTGAIGPAWLLQAACRLPAGLTEIMVHPGVVAAEDAASTRLTEAREKELQALCDPAVREAFGRNGIERTHYGKI